jgi:hypothetical protein
LSITQTFSTDKHRSLSSSSLSSSSSWEATHVSVESEPGVAAPNTSQAHI